MNQYPLGPWVSHFFDIREWMFIIGVNDTGDKREKIWGIYFFPILLRASLSALYTYRLNFCLFFYFPHSYCAEQHNDQLFNILYVERPFHEFSTLVFYEISTIYFASLQIIHCKDAEIVKKLSGK